MVVFHFKMKKILLPLEKLYILMILKLLKIEIWRDNFAVQNLPSSLGQRDGQSETRKAKENYVTEFFSRFIHTVLQILLSGVMKDALMIKLV